mmetsp:Transcript_9610/g.18033  ORF Transcript_9610/g.18033 Transcript_9610/m.18033 type:complete len:681 (-) Transcript_9610:92-2134(-)
MGQYVSVPLVQTVVRERPVPKRGARVVVLDEEHGPGRPDPHDARRPALGIHQPPPLVPAHRLLEYSLGGEVKCGGRSARLVAPVDGALPVLVLIVVQHTLRVVARVPELSDGELRHGAVDVRPGEFPRVPLDVVEPPAVESDRLLHVVQPLDQVLLDKLLSVVDVRRRLVAVAGIKVSRASKLGVVRADGVLVPRQPATKLVPPPLVVLVVGAPMVHHDVPDRLEALGLGRLDQLTQIGLAPVLTVQAVEVPGEVALRADAVGRGRKPQRREAGLGKLGALLLQDLVPVVLAALPVERLENDLVARASRRAGSRASADEEAPFGPSPPLAGGPRDRQALRAPPRRQERLHRRHAPLQDGRGLGSRGELRHHLLRVQPVLCRDLSLPVHGHRLGSPLGGGELLLYSHEVGRGLLHLLRRRLKLGRRVLDVRQLLLDRGHRHRSLLGLLGLRGHSEDGGLAAPARVAARREEVVPNRDPVVLLYLAPVPSRHPEHVHDPSLPRLDHGVQDQQVEGVERASHTHQQVRLVLTFDANYRGPRVTLVVEVNDQSGLRALHAAVCRLSERPVLLRSPPPLLLLSNWGRHIRAAAAAVARRGNRRGGEQAGPWRRQVVQQPSTSPSTHCSGRWDRVGVARLTQAALLRRERHVQTSSPLHGGRRRRRRRLVGLEIKRLLSSPHFSLL